jgi:hypothetical protein
VAGNEDIGYTVDPVLEASTALNELIMGAVTRKHSIDADEFDLLSIVLERREESGRPDFLSGQCEYQIQNGKSRELHFSIRITYS